jgi:hypothetical protein
VHNAINKLVVIVTEMGARKHSKTALHVMWIHPRPTSLDTSIMINHSSLLLEQNTASWPRLRCVTASRKTPAQRRPYLLSRRHRPSQVHQWVQSQHSERAKQRQHRRHWLKKKRRKRRRRPCSCIGVGASCQQETARKHNNDC